MTQRPIVARMLLGVVPLAVPQPAEAGNCTVWVNRSSRQAWETGRLGGSVVEGAVSESLRTERDAGDYNGF